MQASEDELEQRIVDHTNAEVQHLDEEIFYYQNRLRTHPEDFFDYLNNLLDSFDGNQIIDGCGEGCHLNTVEGPSAVEEAILEL